MPGQDEPSRQGRERVQRGAGARFVVLEVGRDQLRAVQRCGGRVRGHQGVTSTDSPGAGQPVGGVPAGVARGEHRHGPAGQVQGAVRGGRRQRQREGGGDVGGAARGDGAGGRPSVRGRRGRTATASRRSSRRTASRHELPGPGGVHRGAVPLVEVVRGTDVVGVRVGDQESGQVLGARADVPHGRLDALRVCGIHRSQPGSPLGPP